MTHNNKKTWKFILKDKIEEAMDVITLRLTPAEGGIFPFIPGQFVNIFFLDDRCGGQGKPYSISSAPDDAFLDITVKKIGKFSGALHALEIGETISLSAPQGFFYPNEETTGDIIFLAGGIGVTPFYSIIKDALAKNNQRNFILFYSNRTESDAAFLKELNELKNSHNNLKVVHVLTRQAIPISAQHESERINIDMLKKYSGTLDGKQYFICGSIGFVRDLWKGLKQNGIPEDHLQVESFY